MARRRKWRRISPERGWLVGNTYGTVVAPTGEGFSNGVGSFIPLVDYDEIDNDDDGTLVTHDKSNWYCVRMLLDIVTQVHAPGVISDETRCCETQLMLVTAQAPVLLAHDVGAIAQIGAPFSYGWYAVVNRILQTEMTITAPVSHGLPIIATDSVATSGPAVSGTSRNDTAMVTRKHVQWDLSTRWSLKPEGTLALLFGANPYLTEYNQGWSEQNFGTVTVNFRLLMQKGVKR